MDYATLVTDLNAMGVTFRNDDALIRASLYYDYLTAAQTYFQETLAGDVAPGLGNNYYFVRNAVRSSSLLTELAEILDFYVSPAIEADLQDQYNNHGHGGNQGWTYRDYFDNIILDADNGTYQQNIADFKQRYPIAEHALDSLAENFQNNIQLCCSRVITDRTDLITFYEDLYPNDFNITRLVKIKSTGSDFHKGGKQVLILTFRGTYETTIQGDEITTNMTLQVIYKPGDIEADCLIAGNSTAINRVTPDFMENSLFEIYNSSLNTYKTANPNFTGEPLDTYRILPRVYNSTHGVNLPLPIRDSYGYIQYLNYDLYWDTIHFWGYYPLAQSDYMIFKGQSADAKISSFYRRAGAFCALASTFSIVDMHIENFRVSAYHPYPIDLELSLTSAVTGITDTSLIKPGSGALNCVSIEGQDSYWVVRNANTKGDAYLERDYPRITYANRLYAWKNDRNKRLVPVNNFYTLQGYGDGMQILRAAQTAGDFDDWFDRLDNVVVRYLPFATPIFKEVVTSVFISQFERDPNAAFQGILDLELQKKLTQYFGTYTDQDPPKFLAFQPDQSGPDYENLDIPVFFYRIGDNSQDIVNSRGEQVPIPANITILQGDPAQPTQVNCQPPHVGRTTFFSNVPTTDIVKTDQVDILDGNGYQNRFTTLQTSIMAALGIQAAPDNPGVLIPTNP